MKHYYWRVDTYIVEINDWKIGTIIYASEFQASQESKRIEQTTNNKARIVKCEWGF